MAEQKEFKPLFLAGSVSMNDTSEIRFFVDEFKGHKYASIRTFVKRDSYSGPTKAGVTMNQRVLETVIEKLAPLPTEPEHTEEFQIGRIEKKPELELVLRITIYRDETGIDFREFVDEEERGGYKGWSKKGVRVLYADLPKVREYLTGMRDFLKKSG
jgi:hypothetical protein